MALEKTRGLNYNLSDLLDGIEAGTLVLPDFQRDFDWNTNQVRQLIATVLLGWPMGSLLLLPATANALYKVREFSGAPKTLSPELIVLDGQQRLTALFHALRGAGKGRYVLDIAALEAEPHVDDIEDSIEWLGEKEWLADYATPELQLASNKMPITALQSAVDFYEWRDVATENDKSRLNFLTDLYKSRIAGLHKYEVPAALINNDTPSVAVARIFERVNRLGRPLGTFDLVVARSYEHNFNLRDKWEEAVRKYPRLKPFLGDDGLPVLNAIALRERESVRAQAVLDLEGETVRSLWDEAASATHDAIRFLESQLGVWDSDWLPYKSFLTVLSSLAMDRDLFVDNEELIRWYWTTAFSQGFNVASNTRAVSAYINLRDGVPEERSVLLDKEDLLASNKKQFGSLHRTLLTYIASLNPSNVLNGNDFESIDGLAPPSGAPLPLLPRDDQGSHLRSLAMVLVTPGEARQYASVDWTSCEAPYLASQLVPVFEAQSKLDLLQDRLELISISLTERIGLQVKIVDRTDT